MLEIAQTGIVGKTHFLFDMHRLRKRVFKDRMGWNVRISPGGLEVDDFDIPEAVYLLALDDDGRVIGNWRMLPTHGPTMIRDVWPQFLESLPMPRDPLVWETSRFAVDSLKNNPEEGMAQVSRATQELFCGITELCLLCGIREIFTMYDMRIARLLKRLDCHPRAVSTRLSVADHLSQVGAFVTDQTMLKKIRTATGITESLINPKMLPPALESVYQKNKALSGKPVESSLEMVE